MSVERRYYGLTDTQNCAATSACPSNVSVPTVATTSPATNITQTTATDGGTIVSNGGATVLASGIVSGTITQSQLRNCRNRHRSNH